MVAGPPVPEPGTPQGSFVILLSASLGKAAMWNSPVATTLQECMGVGGDALTLGQGSSALAASGKKYSAKGFTFT